MNRSLSLLSSLLLGLFVTHSALAAPKGKRGKKAESAESAKKASKAQKADEDEEEAEESSAPAKGGKNDAKATKAAEDAQADYADKNFKKAEKKLKAAIKQCGDDKCSAKVRGQLHRDLAVVYIAGMKNTKKGKTEMKLAVEADPDLELDSASTTPEVEKAFVDAGGKKAKEAEPEEEEKAEPEEEEEEKPEESAEEKPDCDPESDEGCEKPKEAEEEAAPAGGAKQNWLSLVFQQDFLFFSSEKNICFGENQWECYQGGKVYDGDIYPDAGNQVAGGLGAATKRILLGYDRALGSSITLGARLGFAFGGSPAGFLPIHAELRGAYWFTSNPFQGSGFHPYIALALGAASVDGRVTVEYFASKADYDAYQATKDKQYLGTVDAWRKTGKIFVSPSLGARFGFTESGLGLIAELRMMQMLGASATGLAGNIGFSMGL